MPGNLIELPPPGTVFRQQRIVRRTTIALRRLGIPAGAVDIEQVAGVVSDRLGVRIEMVSHLMPVPGMFAATFADKTGFVIFYQQATSAMHQRHHVAHELAHILTGTVFAPGQSKPDDAIERDTETVANAIACWIRLRDARIRAVQPTLRQQQLAALLDDLSDWA